MDDGSAGPQSALREQRLFAGRIQVCALRPSRIRPSMFTLDRVVPWGRSFDEYRRMFGLPDKDLALRIIGCGDGPAAWKSIKGQALD